MIQNYFKIAFRNLRKNPGYSFINIGGLTIGISCCLLILLYVWHELSYDRFHEKFDDIYRLGVEFQMPGSTFENALSSAPMAPTLLDDYPEILEAVRFHASGSDLLVTNNDRRFYEDKFFFADASVFDVFTFPLLDGDPTTALLEPNSIVLTESIAQKYFSEEDPIGKILMVNQERVYTVTGVMKDLPDNSHLQFDFLASFSSLEELMGERLEMWASSSFFTYVLLRPGIDQETFNTKLASFVDNHAGEQLATIDWKLTAFLQPLSEIHLYPLANEQQGDIQYIYVISSIAVFILFIACINFINLSTARSTTRVREIGMRKALGAHRGQLIRQFLSESMLTTGISVLGAIILVDLLLPIFSVISGKTLGLNQSGLLVVVIGLLAIILFIGLVSGGYTAFYLTSFKPLEVLKTKFTTGPHSSAFRKGLVVFQFTVSITLLVSTMVVHNQLQHMRSKDVGFNKEQVIIIPVEEALTVDRQETIKTELLQVPLITQVALASNSPSQGAGGTIATRPDSPDRPPEIKVLQIDSDFLETLDINLIAGRNFMENLTTDRGTSIILNETAAESFGWSQPEDAVGQTLEYFWGEPVTGTVIGIVQDFNFQSLHFGIQPLMLLSGSDSYQYFHVRVTSGGTEQTIAHLGEVWSRVAPQWPFVYSFLEEELDGLYRSEQRLEQIFRYFTILAIVISCLGLFGLATFTVEQRTKEVGIRKVMGATVTNIVGLLSKDFVKLVMTGFLVALPIAWYVMNRWLQDFVYRIDIGAGVFFMAGLAAIIIALVTVSWQSVKAALMNPVNSLRSE